ncbi:hypothetical protein HKCCE2091_10370 [Rhodobacterales bacterium HKCCE2091]|nr:hypothetical protein [Rhodobacterales bacterium HKCCE2091]
MHLALLLVLILSPKLTRTDPQNFQVTGVTILSNAEFEAMTLPGTAPDVEPPPEPAAPPPPAEPEPQPEAPAPEPPAPEVSQPEAAEPPAPETAPEPTEPLETPQASVSEDVAILAPPELGDPSAEQSDTPTPQEAPRVAPTPAPAPPPDVEVAPEVVEQPDPTPEPAEVAEPEVEQTAPEEAATQIVTEAEDPSSAPLASIRPPSRPNRPAPEPEPQTAAAEPEPAPEPDPEPEPQPQPDAQADAIAAAVAAANTETAPAPPAGPPLTQGQRDGFRIAVQGCWNVGSLSSEALQTTVTVGVSMLPDGRPDAGSIRLIERSGGSETAATQAFEAARRAIIRCGVNGYSLPSESYEHWREVEMVFNPEGMRLR